MVSRWKNLCYRLYTIDSLSNKALNWLNMEGLIHQSFIQLCIEYNPFSTGLLFENKDKVERIIE